MTKQYRADLALVIATIGWSLSYIFMKNAMLTLETFNLLGIRFLLSALGMSLIFHKRLKNLDKMTRNSGIIIGIFLFSAYAFQSSGLRYTTISKSAFITGFSTIIVPILSALIFKKMPKTSAIIGVILAFTGLACLTFDGDLGLLNIGDLYTLAGSFCFAFHILMVGKYAVKVDSINVTILQVAVVGVLSLITSFLFESPKIPLEPGVWGSLSFLVIICTIIGFILQNVAQKYTSATHTSLILSSEPFFASIFAYLLMGEILQPKGVFGGFLIVLGILISEFNFKIPILSKLRTPEIIKAKDQTVKMKDSPKNSYEKISCKIDI